MKLIDLDADKDYILDGKYAIKAGKDYVPIDEEWERGYTAGQMAEKKELVRCKDCKWYMPTSENYGKCTYRTREHLLNEPSDYCSYGERKDNE